jgi:hypothetical protein
VCHLDLDRIRLGSPVVKTLVLLVKNLANPNPNDDDRVDMTTTITQRTKDAIADGKIIGDGHTIFNPSFYAPHFSEDELRKAKLIHTYKSDASSHKSTIFGKDGKPMEKLKGVYNLTFLYWLCGQLGIDSNNDFNGRGSQADALASRIRKALA